MSNTVVKTDDQNVRATLSLLQDMLGDYHPRNFAVRLWDGTVWEAEPGQPTLFTFVLNHPGAARSLFPPSELKLGEAYIYGDFDIEGDLYAAVSMSDGLLDMNWSLAEKLSYALRLLRLPSKKGNRINGLQPVKETDNLHTQERDREVTSYHYDVSNDFFSLWLDDTTMLYSCAYFQDPDEDIVPAQIRKLDYICRKLRLQEGERMLDVGCGWGALTLYAAQNYNVTVKGITLGQPQADYANEKIREAGMQDRCHVEVMDYRDINEPEQYDKLASIGMFGHVGADLLPLYFRKAWELLRPGGVFLQHGMARDYQSVSRGRPFLTRHVFPDGELTHINNTIRFAEQAGFELRDVESLREHYILTIEHWMRRFNLNQEQIRAMVDDVTFRITRIGVPIFKRAFVTKRNNLYQVLLSKSDGYNSGFPLSRADWYTE